jgi:hypothetical protein
MHAAIGRARLAKLPGWTKQRQQNAKFLDANLRGVVLPDDRDGFARALAAEHGIGLYYLIPATGCRPSAACWTFRKPSVPRAEVPRKLERYR